MNESDARSVLLVRAYETAPPLQTHGRWTDDDRGWATQAALQVEAKQASVDAVIARRGRLAAERICARDSGARRVLHALTWRGWMGWALMFAAFVAGILTDSIGPARQINVLAPPTDVPPQWQMKRDGTITQVTFDLLDVYAVVVIQLK